MSYNTSTIFPGDREPIQIFAFEVINFSWIGIHVLGMAYNTESRDIVLDNIVNDSFLFLSSKPVKNFGIIRSESGFILNY